MKKPDLFYAHDFQQMKGQGILLYGEFEKEFFSLFRQRTAARFFVMEGRPTLSAGQSCCAGLLKEGIRPTVICENMAGFLFFKEMVKEVWLSYVEAGERGALCLIGSSILGLLAKAHQVPVYCYPAQAKLKKEVMSTGKELTHFAGVPTAPKGVKTYVPLLEWVPGQCFEESAVALIPASGTEGEDHV